MEMPDTHKVLLKTMLQYELDNFVLIRINETTNYKTEEFRLLLEICGYLTSRIKELT